MGVNVPFAKLGDKVEMSLFKTYGANDIKLYIFNVKGKMTILCLSKTENFNRS